MTECDSMTVNIYAETDTTCANDPLSTTFIDPRLNIFGLNTTTNACSAKNGLAGSVGYGTITCGTTAIVVTETPNLLAR